MELLYILVIGAVSGWLAGMIMKTSGGLLMDVILGIVGSFVGGWVLAKLGIRLNIGSPTISLIVTSVIGAVVVLLQAEFLAGLDEQPFHLKARATENGRVATPGAIGSLVDFGNCSRLGLGFQRFDHLADLLGV